MFFKKKKQVEEVKVEVPQVNVEELKHKAQTLIASLEGKSGDDRISTLDEIGILLADAQEIDEAIHYLEISLSEKKSLGNGYRKLLSLYNIKRREAAEAKDDEQIQYYLKKIDEMIAISKEVTRSSF